jgi:hypothetical protein
MILHYEMDMSLLGAKGEMLYKEMCLGTVLTSGGW